MLSKKRKLYEWKEVTSKYTLLKTTVRGVTRVPDDLQDFTNRRCAWNTNIRLESDFYNQVCPDLAISLLGQILVRKHPDGTELRGRIIETEAYLGGDDKASHSRGGKCTERNVAMYMKPGTIYVYQVYGIHFCMNISSKEDGAAVLLRSLEPLDGLNIMRELRSIRRNENSKPIKDKELCNGPSKLCQAMDIDIRFDKKDLTDDQSVWLEAGPKILAQDIVSCARVGIDSAGAWAHKPFRFYVKGNKYVSVRNKTAEASLDTIGI